MTLSRRGNNQRLNAVAILLKRHFHSWVLWLTKSCFTLLYEHRVVPITLLCSRCFLEIFRLFTSARLSAEWSFKLSHSETKFDSQYRLSNCVLLCLKSANAWFASSFACWLSLTRYKVRFLSDATQVFLMLLEIVRQFLFLREEFFLFDKQLAAAVVRSYWRWH